MASIEKRSENTYRITVSNGYNSHGEKIRKRKTVTIDSKMTEKQIEKELQIQAALFEDEVKSGTYIDAGKITFSEFCDRWLTNYAEKDLEAKTVFRYKEMLTSRIIPAIGHIKLGKLQPIHLIEFYNNLAETGIRLDSKYIATHQLSETMDINKMKISELVELSNISDTTIKSALKGNPVTKKSAEAISKALNIKFSILFIQSSNPGSLSSRTILHHHRLISSILTSAVHWQVILNNPAERVKAPKTDKKEVQHYNEEQTKQLLNALEHEELKYKVMVFLDVFTGLRLGELMGLSWSNINFDNNTIEIKKASQHLSGRGTFEKNPKNETSIRTITIPSPVAVLLKKYHKWWLAQEVKMGNLWKESDRLFVTWDGRPMFTYTLTNWFPDFLKRHNLPKITPHGLRHTSATLLAAQGLEVSAISKRLGHSRTSTTMDIYVHALKRSDSVASELLEKALIGDKQNQSKGVQ